MYVMAEKREAQGEKDNVLVEASQPTAEEVWLFGVMSALISLLCISDQQQQNDVKPVSE